MLKLGETARRGQQLFASRPLVRVTILAKKAAVCDNCCLRASTKPCSGCGCDHYCSDTCRAQAWDFHQLECHFYRNYRPKVMPDLASLLAKLVIKLKNGGHRVKDRIHGSYGRRFKDLMTHRAEILQDDRIMPSFRTYEAQVLDFLGEDFIPDNIDLLDLFGALVINVFHIIDIELEQVGVGLYMAASSFNHSCRPNATAVFNGPEMAITLVEDVPNFQWDKIFVSYIDVLDSQQSRQNQLMKSHYFLCQCELCLDAAREALEDSIMCGNLQCEAPVLVPSSASQDSGHTLQCGKCGYKGYPTSTVQQYRAIVSACDAEITKMSVDGSDECCLALVQHQLQLLHLLKDREKGADVATTGPLLHPLNVHRVRHMDAAMEVAMTEPCNYKLAMIIGNNNSLGMKHYHHKMEMVYLLFLVNYATALHHEGNHTEALSYARQAEQGMRALVAPQHPLIKTYITPLLKKVRSNKISSNSSSRIISNSRIGSSSSSIDQPRKAALSARCRPNRQQQPLLFGMPVKQLFPWVVCCLSIFLISLNY